MSYFCKPIFTLIIVIYSSSFVFAEINSSQTTLNKEHLEAVIGFTGIGYKFQTKQFILNSTWFDYEKPHPYAEMGIQKNYFSIEGGCNIPYGIFIPAFGLQYSKYGTNQILKPSLSLKLMSMINLDVKFSYDPNWSIYNKGGTKEFNEFNISLIFRPFGISSAYFLFYGISEYLNKKRNKPLKKLTYENFN